MRKLILSVLFMAICGGLGLSGAYYHPTQWQVNVEVEAPKVNELGNYFSLFSTYSLVSGNVDAVDMSKLERKATLSAFSEFQNILTSPAQLMSFLRESRLVKMRSDIERQEMIDVITQIASHFKFKSKENGVELTLSSFDRQEVDQIFVEYVRYANNQARHLLNNDLVERWKLLFQQVKKAADAKIDASWENKLKMMQSVQPLDNNLVAFHFVQQPEIVIAPKPYVLWGGVGVALGLLLSLLAMLILGKNSRKKPDDVE